MKRGATQTFVFDLYDQNIEDIVACEITFSQNGYPVIKKTKNDCKVYKNSFVVDLSQEETFLFDDEKADVQIRIKKKSGAVLSSDIGTINVGESLSNEVI